MCGTTGFYAFEGNNNDLNKRLDLAIDRLSKRGPDRAASFHSNHVGLGHTRLSILDTSELGNQPMSDNSGRYTLVFNGEIYNYRDVQKELKGVSLKSSGDTEVLLHLLIQQGTRCLNKLNGFFAFAFYDKHEDQLMLARDRMGIKPLHYFEGNDFLAFASEMKALLEYPVPRIINKEALNWYLRLNYLPGTLSMIEGIKELKPGHFLLLGGRSVDIQSFIAPEKTEEPNDYSVAQKSLVDLLDKSVQKRLISDVPLGAFLSGGTDSSAIVSLASRHVEKLSTYSIGYVDNPFFDETHYAELVARKFKTDHTTFKLTNDDLLEHLDEIITYIDGPFADSSAIPTYILSKRVREHVTVALSGDGADELFGGYYKHQALARGLAPSTADLLAKYLHPVTGRLPSSRSTKIGNLVRRLNKLGSLHILNATDRYWFLASMTYDPHPYLDSKWVHSFDAFDGLIPNNPSLTDYLEADQEIVLSGDMLTKVDLMSMANSLEVRVPFLDISVVDFANSLPTEFKVNGKERKRILQDAFRQILPSELYQRPKKGFEVPLLQWMRKELLSDLDQTLFNQDFLEDQGIFNTQHVLSLRKKLTSKNPGDVHGLIWALFIFQKWYKSVF